MYLSGVKQRQSETI